MKYGVQVNEEHKVLTYADDTALISENMNDREALYIRLGNKWSKEKGVQVNMDKTW